MNLKCWCKSIISLFLLKIYFPKIIFKVINSPRDLEEVYKLTWQVYGLEKQYINTNTSPPEIFKDKYEKYSVVIGAFKKGNLIGTMRLICPSPLGFYAEEDFNIDLSPLPRREIIELARLAVLGDYRIKSLISFGLFRKAFEISKIRGIKYWIVVVPEKIKNYFSEFFNIKFHQLNLKELTGTQVKTRSKMINYYKVNNPAPYIIPLKEIY